MNTLQVILAPEQLAELADMIVARMGAKPKAALTLHEAAAELQLSTCSIRRMIHDGTLKRVPGISKILIPTSEINRITS